jgi:uncharacterized protein YbcI
MSDVVSMVDSLKFENKITKITKTYVGRPKSAIKTPYAYNDIITEKYTTQLIHEYAIAPIHS